MFDGTPRKVRLEGRLLPKIRDYFLPFAAQRHLAKFEMPVDAGVLEHRIPGGMWSNYVVQLAGMGLGERMKEVLELFPAVWEKLGYPPLVTPTSQIVGVEVALTVLRGENYQRSTQVVDYVNGKYGKPLGKIDPGLQKKIVGHNGPIDYDAPMEIPPDALGRCAAELREKGLLQSERDAISYAMFPSQAMALFLWRAGKGPCPREKEDPSIGRAELLRRDAGRVAEAHYQLFRGYGAGSVHSD